MKILKRCIAAALALTVCGAQLFCPGFIDNDNIMVTYALESRISESGIALIKEFEGYVQYAQWDYQQWSIGYGTGVDKDAYPNGITEPEADRLLREAVLTYEGYVQTFLIKNNIKVTQNQYDALVSFTYNLGNVWAYTSEVTIRTYLINGINNYTPQQIKDAFGLWVKAGGQVNDGLVRRRAREAEIFLSDGEYMPEVSSGERWRITSATGVRLRNDPDTTSEIQGVLPYNSVINITEKKNSEGFLWGKVDSGSVNGWCVLDYAEKMSGNLETVVVPDAPEKFEKWRITSETGVNMRYNYGISSQVIDFIPFNTVITAYEIKEADGYVWARTEYNGQPGWCVLNYASRIITDSAGNPVLVGIKVDRLPDRTVYTAGELFNNKGMKVTAVYSDGTQKEVYEYGCSANTTVPGTSQVHIDYLGKTTDFEISINAVKGDLNANGFVDTDDGFSLNRFILGGSTPENLKTSGDINGDGSIDVIDSILARKKILENYSKDN